MTFSRLTLGEPRLKSKLRGGEVSNEPPCEQDVVTGVDLLNGRGDMETYVSDTGRTEITKTENSAAQGDLSWGDGTVVEAFDPGGRQTLLPAFQSGLESISEIGEWHVSTVAPDTGTHHIRITGHAPTFVGGNSQRLFFAPGMVCPDLYIGREWHADRYPPGAVVTLQFRAKTSIVDNVRITWEINNIVNGVVLGSGFQRLTTSYTTYSVSGIIDMNAFPNTQHVYPTILADFDNENTTDTHVDIDNVTYGIE